MAYVSISSNIKVSASPVLPVQNSLADIPVCKGIIASLLFILLVTEISCASKPQPLIALPVDTVSLSVELPEREREDVYEEPFERALRNVKQNTGLFNKYIEGGIDVVSAGGIVKAEDIRVKGECIIDGKRFQVTYDLTGAAANGGTLYRIPFLLENLTDDVSRSDELYLNFLKDEAALLLSFDDNYWNAWTELIDVFDRYNAKVTFFIQGSLDPDFEDAGAIREFCREVLSRGHDLGYHTVHHYNLLSVSQKVFNSEVFKGAESFIPEGIALSAFAFPFGFSQPWMREVLAPVFPLTRGYGRNIRLYNPETIKSGYVISAAIDNIIYPDDKKFEYDMRLILLAAKFTGNIIVPLTSHEFSDTAQWGIKPSRLEFLLKTAQELQMRFYTYRDIRRLFLSQ